MIAIPITSHTIYQWYSRIASVIVAIVIVTENAIVLFYNQLCDCKYNNRKEIMLKMVTIFTMVNSLQEYSYEHTQTHNSQQHSTMIFVTPNTITCERNR